jgi:hypothetical protein
MNRTGLNQELVDLKDLDNVNNNHENEAGEEAMQPTKRSRFMNTFIDLFEELNLPPYISIERINEDKKCHDSKEVSIPLVGRHDVLKHIGNVWTSSMNAFTEKPVPNDRTLYPIPFCVGLSGVGKTRILEESKRIFLLHVDHRIEEAAFELVSVLVLYFNGHGVTPTDRELPIQTTFSARLLHRVYFEGNANYPTFESFMSDISNLHPDHTEKLTIVNVILAVKDTLLRNGKKISKDHPLIFLLGVDEFQNIPDHVDIHESKLYQLTNLLIDAFQELVECDVYLFACFAGTAWSKVRGCGESSNANVKRIKVPFLSYSQCLQISSSINPRLCASRVFKDLLFEFSGNTRGVVKYTYSLSTYPNPSSEEMLKKKIGELDQYIRAWSNLEQLDLLLTLAAYSISGIYVDSVGFPCKETDNRTWVRLADKGIVSLNKTQAAPLYTVDLPIIALIVLSSRLSTLTELPPDQSAFRHCLRNILDVGSKRHLTAWQRWESFGAYFHALRINSFLILGRREVSMEELFAHGKHNSNSFLSCKVALLPLRVVSTEIKLAEDTPEVIEEVNNMNCTYNWMDGKEIFMNGTNGKGVDIFFVLHTAETESRKILILDQRKHQADNLAKAEIKDISSMMDQTKPKVFCQIQRTKVLKLIFSALSCIGKRSSAIKRY